MDFFSIHVKSGAMRWQDLMDLASPASVADIYNLQREIDINEAANIQFTSVNCKFHKTLQTKNFDIA
jgi:hypothetical protein